MMEYWNNGAPEDRHGRHRLGAPLRAIGFVWRNRLQPRPRLPIRRGQIGFVLHNRTGVSRPPGRLPWEDWVCFFTSHFKLRTSDFLKLALFSMIGPGRLALFRTNGPRPRPQASSPAQPEIGFVCSQWHPSSLLDTPHWACCHPRLRPGPLGTEDPELRTAFQPQMNADIPDETIPPQASYPNHRSSIINHQSRGPSRTRDVPLYRGRVARIVPEFWAQTTTENGATPCSQRNKEFFARGVFCLFNCCTNANKEQWNRG
jgi:hypothetical protein